MDEMKAPRPLAVVTGASSGIGYHLAMLAAQHGYDLVVAADRPLKDAVADFKAAGAQQVHAVETELASRQGVDQLINRLQGHEVDALMANAGHGLGGAFLDQGFEDIQHVIDTNVTGTIYLMQHVARGMVARGRGRILVTGSIAGFQPGTFHAVYNGSRPGDGRAPGLRRHAQGRGRRRGRLEEQGAGIASKVMPAQAAAQMHRKLAEPGSAKHNHPEHEEVHPIGGHK